MRCTIIFIVNKNTGRPGAIPGAAGVLIEHEEVLPAGAFPVRKIQLAAAGNAWANDFSGSRD